VSRTNNVQKLSSNAHGLVKCSKSSTITYSMFKSNAVTDYYNSSCQSNPINSTLDTATTVHRFKQTSVLRNKLPYIMKLLLVSKRNRKHIYGTFSNIKIAYSQRQQYQPRNDHPNSTLRNALDRLTGITRWG